jgi:membrane protein
VLVFGPQLTRLVLQELQLGWMQTRAYFLIRWGTSAGFMLIVSSLLYWIVPTPRVRYYVVSPGSLFATIGSVATTVGLGYYVDSFHRFNETYGTLGGIIALMIWFHLTGIFLLTGGLINGVIYRHACGLESGRTKKQKLRTLSSL